jgi:hypothetical protein
MAPNTASSSSIAWVVISPFSRLIIVDLSTLTGFIFFEIFPEVKSKIKLKKIC